MPTNPSNPESQSQQPSSLPRPRILYGPNNQPLRPSNPVQSTDRIPLDPNHPVDHRNQRVIHIQNRTLTTEMGDWLTIAQGLVYEAVFIPDTHRQIAKDAVTCSNMIVTGLRMDRQRPVRPENRVAIKFKGAEFDVVVQYCKQFPRDLGDIVNANNGTEPDPPTT